MFDIRTFTADYGLSIAESGHHHCHEGWAQLHCPFCTNGLDGFHLGFSLRHGNLNCWRCGHVSLWDYLREIFHSTDRRLIVETINKYQSGSTPSEKREITRKNSIKEPMGTGPMEQAHRRYLRERGFNPFQVEREWGLKATAHLSNSEWGWRIIIPIYNSDRDIVAYQGRTIRDDVKPKYRMSNNEDILMNPRSLLYGIERVPGDSVIIVEGVTGVWKIGIGTVATFGIDWKEEQARILRRYKNRYIIFDPEKLAQRRAKELAKWLANFPGNTEVVDEFGSDPGEFSEKTISDIKKELLGFTD